MIQVAEKPDVTELKIGKQDAKYGESKLMLTLEMYKFK